MLLDVRLWRAAAVPLLAAVVAVACAAAGALAAHRSPVRVVSDGGYALAFYPAWARGGDAECYASTCANEHVVNVFVRDVLRVTAAADAVAQRGSTCAWAARLAGDDAVDAAAAAWPAFRVGQFTLDVAPLLRRVFSPTACLETLRADDGAVLVAGPVPRDAVRINVIDGSAAPVIERDAFASDFVCWRYPSRCGAANATSLVVNVVLADGGFCRSSCFAPDAAAAAGGGGGGGGGGAEPPRCYSAGCVHGRCVAHNTCLCDVGFDGATCATRVGCDTDGCSGRGACDAASGACTCDDGWEGARCATASAPPAPPSPPPTPAPPAAHGNGAIMADERWLLPFEVFPDGPFSHLSWFSNGQIVRTDRHCPGSEAINGTGWFGARVDYTTSTMYFEMAYTVPRGALTNPRIELRCAYMGERGPLVAVLSDPAVARPRPIYSWHALEWEAVAYNGTVHFDPALNPLFADNGIYTTIKSDERPEGHLRVQLARYDRPLTAKLLPSPARHGNDAVEGAVIFVLDEHFEKVEFWVHYTAPLSYLELTGDIDQAGDYMPLGPPQPDEFGGANDPRYSSVYPLPMGHADLRRIGFYDKWNDPPRQIVCVINKYGIWRYGNGKGTDRAKAIAAALKNDTYLLRIHSAQSRISEIEGTIAHP